MLAADQIRDPLVWRREQTLREGGFAGVQESLPTAADLVSMQALRPERLELG